MQLDKIIWQKTDIKRIFKNMGISCQEQHFKLVMNCSLINYDDKLTHNLSFTRENSNFKDD